MDNKVQFFEKKHYPEICKWFKGQGLSSPNFSYLPVNGFIVPGVAAGFLYMTDSAISILDCFISNPKSTSEDRDSALDWIAMHLTNCAHAHGTKIVICNTQLPAVRDRAVKLGFQETGKHYALAKELT